MTEMLRRTPYAGALLTGLLIGISFPPGFLGALAWIGLVPLLLRLSSSVPWRNVVLECLAASAITTVIVGYWTLFHPLASARAASLAGLVVLSIVAAIPFSLYGLPGRDASLPLRIGLLIGSATVIEYAQFHTEIGFPWLALGHTQATLFPINQLAAFVGAPGLSSWVVLCNALLVPLVLQIDRRHRFFSFTFGIFLLASLSIGLLQSQKDRSAADIQILLAVQPGLSAENWSDVRDRSRPVSLMELSEIGAEAPPDVIVWPETSLPVLEKVDAPSSEYLRLAAFVDRVGVPILTGAVIQEPDDAGEIVYYNSAVLLSPDIGITARYDKRIPVPFAERVPYVDRYAWLQRLAVASGGVEGYAAGSRSSQIEVNEVAVGILICFESVFPKAVRDADSEMPAYFIVLAQDGWWGDTAGYRQHFAITRLRAIETGRAVVQVTVTGITGLILPDGTTVDETKWMERTVRRYKVPIYRGTTPYTKFGDLPVLFFGLILFVSGLALHLRVKSSGV